MTQRGFCRRSLLLLACAALLAGAPGCTYFANRGRDSAQMMDLGFTWSSKPQFGLYANCPLITPIGYSNVDGHFVGVGGGKVGAMEHHQHNKGVLVWGEEDNSWGSGKADDPKHVEKNKAGVVGIAQGIRQGEQNYKPACIHYLHLGWVGLMWNIRYYEIGDFFVGWVGYDPARDDVRPGRTLLTRRPKSAPTALAAAPKAEPKPPSSRTTSAPARVAAAPKVEPKAAPEAPARPVESAPARLAAAPKVEPKAAPEAAAHPVESAPARLAAAPKVEPRAAPEVAARPVESAPARLAAAPEAAPEADSKAPASAPPTVAMLLGVAPGASSKPTASAPTGDATPLAAAPEAPEPLPALDPEPSAAEHPPEPEAPAASPALPTKASLLAAKPEPKAPAASEKGPGSVSRKVPGSPSAGLTRATASSASAAAPPPSPNPRFTLEQLVP